MTGPYQAALASPEGPVNLGLPGEPVRGPLTMRAAPPTGPSRGRAQIALPLVAVVVAVAALELAEEFLVPLLVAIVAALALAPIVRRMTSWMPRPVAAALVVGIMAAGLGGMAYSLSDETAAALAELPQVTRRARKALNGTLDQPDTALAQLRQTVTEVERAARESARPTTTPSGVMAVQIVEPPLDLQNYMWWGSRGLLSGIGGLLIVLFLVYFLLASGAQFKRKLVQMSGRQLSRRRTAVRVVDAISQRVARYLLHMVMMGTLVGVATWLVFLWIGVAYAGLWGLAAGLLNAVPYFGPTIVAMASTLAALAQFGEVPPALLVGASSLAITGVEGLLISPYLVGQLARVNPVAVFVSFLFWGWLWGAWGVLLAMPLLVIVKTIAESVPAMRTVGELLD